MILNFILIFKFNFKFPGNKFRKIKFPENSKYFPETELDFQKNSFKKLDFRVKIGYFFEIFIEILPFFSVRVKRRVGNFFDLFFLNMHI